MREAGKGLHGIGHGGGFGIRAVAGAFAIVATLLFAATAAAAEQRSFILHNRTGVDIEALFVSPNQVDDWRQSVLDGEPILDGDDAEIVFSRTALAAVWDLKLVDRDGASLVWPRLDLGKHAEFTLRLERGKPVVIAE